MKQGNAAIQRKQVKQISVFRGWRPLCEFSRYMFLGVWPFFLFIKVSTHEPKVYTNRCHWNWEKVKKVNQLLNFWSFHLYLSVVLYDTPGLILFIGGYLRLNRGFCCLSRI